MPAKKAAGASSKPGTAATAQPASQEQASAFVNEQMVFELESRRAALRELQKTSEHLRRDNDVLRDEMRAQQADSASAVDFLHRESESRRERIVELEDIIKQKQVEQEELVEAHREREQRIVATYDKRIGELNATAADLRAKLTMYAAFEVHRAELEATLNRTNEELRNERLERKQEVDALEVKFFEDKKLMLKEHEREKKFLQRMAEEQLAQRLDVQTRAILMENVRISQALTEHMKMSESMRVELESLHAEIQQMKIEREVDRQAIEEVTRASQQRKARVVELESKCAALEQGIAMAQDKLASQNSAFETFLAGKTEQLRNEIARLSKSLELRNSELLHVKRLARSVLAQRTDAERFLIDALDRVRRESEERRRQDDEQLEYESHAGGAVGARGPALSVAPLRQRLSRVRASSVPRNAGGDGAASTHAAGNLSSSSRASLLQGDTLLGSGAQPTELSLGEKERVLALLLARIHEGNRPEEKLLHRVTSTTDALSAGAADAVSRSASRVDLRASASSAAESGAPAQLPPLLRSGANVQRAIDGGVAPSLRADLA